MSSLLPSSFIRSKATNQKNKIVLTKRNSHEPNLSDQNETLMNQTSPGGNFSATVISGNRNSTTRCSGGTSISATTKSPTPHSVVRSLSSATIPRSSNSTPSGGCC